MFNFYDKMIARSRAIYKYIHVCVHIHKGNYHTLSSQSTTRMLETSTYPFCLDILHHIFGLPKIKFQSCKNNLIFSLSIMMDLILGMKLL
jgi:hypothetical protein